MCQCANVPVCLQVCVAAINKYIKIDFYVHFYGYYIHSNFVGGCELPIYSFEWLVFELIDFMEF